MNPKNIKKKRSDLVKSPENLDTKSKVNVVLRILLRLNSPFIVEYTSLPTNHDNFPPSIIRVLGKTEMKVSRS